MRLLTMCEWSLFLFGADMQTFARFICTFAHKLYTPIMEFEVTLKHKIKGSFSCVMQVVVTK